MPKYIAKVTVAQAHDLVNADGVSEVPLSIKRGMISNENVFVGISELHQWKIRPICENLHGHGESRQDQNDIGRVKPCVGSYFIFPGVS